MPPKKRPSRQDLIRAQQRSAFVGRVEQLETFQHNLTHLQIVDGFAYPGAFLFNIWGQGGVGKTTLLRQFEAIAKGHQHVVARIDEAITTVPEVMAAFAKQLADQGQPLAKFSERYKVYRHKREELETDPEAPQGFSAFVGKTVTKVGLKLGRQVPIAGAALDFVDEEGLVEGAGEWATFVSRKLKNKDEIQLVNEPLGVLTPLFLEGLETIADRQMVLLFDTYERTGEVVEPWLLDILAERHGVLPPNCIWVIAGRDRLNPNDWSGYDPVQFPLEPFTAEEATQFLQRKGVTNAEVISTILDVSGRLPLLLAILAESSPNDPVQVGEASGTAVERFLKWVEDPAKRQLALDAALPQSLNRDVVAQLVDEETDVDALYGWLKTMPFVGERSDGWAYHDVVRPQMLRYQQRESAKSWAEKHGVLAAYYDGCAQQLDLEDDKVRYADATWQSYALRRLYHQLCSHPQQKLAVALNQFLDALKQNSDFAQQWAAVMLQAGQELEVKALCDWGKRLMKGLQAYEDDGYGETVTVLTDLLNAEVVKAEKYSIIYSWRGNVYRLMSAHEKALQDFNCAVGLEPEYQWAIAHRGITYRFMERYEEALTDFSRAIELNSEDKWAIAHRGITYRFMERYEEALTDLNCAIELDPEYKWAIAQRGSIYRFLESYEEALEDFNRAIELDPEDKWAITGRGRTYHSIKSYKEALQDFNRAIELDAEYKRAAANRGEVYLLLRQYDEALLDFKASMDTNNDWDYYRQALAYLGLKQIESTKAHLTQAIQIAQKNHEKVPNNHRHTFNLALYHLVSRKLDKGKHFYQEALSREAPVLFLKGAIQDLQDLLTIFPNYPHAQEMKGFLESALSLRQLKPQPPQIN
ncbi:MAG: tetratricopeptide repeat protein [Cyanobacteria bacterium P01_A01_bin.123]